MKTKSHIVVGLDMATKKEKQGVAVGNISDGRIKVVSVGDGWILDRILNDYNPTLLAIDSPLGWPAAMHLALCGHRAGEKITASPDKVFQRATDEFIKDKFGKRPLQVGANLIARTAHAACELLGERKIPVRLKPGILKCLSAIEVYPAATLLAHNWSREDLLKSGNFVFQREGDQKRAEGNDDIFDACVCLLAARDFLLDKCYKPQKGDAEKAKIEGWIWVKQRDA